MADRRLSTGGRLFEAAAAFTRAETRTLDLSARPGRPARTASIELRHGEVAIRRPDGAEKTLPESVALRVVLVSEPAPPDGTEPGFGLEDSQVESADRLMKLTAIAARAAVITLQLVQCRDGDHPEPASLIFDRRRRATLPPAHRTSDQSPSHQDVGLGRLDYCPTRRLGRIP
jgi:hypothetical protein